VRFPVAFRAIFTVIFRLNGGEYFCIHSGEIVHSGARKHFKRVLWGQLAGILRLSGDLQELHVLNGEVIGKNAIKYILLLVDHN
jgi:hypothetical protein